MSYGVSFVNICEKIERVITAPYCILEKTDYTGTTLLIVIYF